MIRLVHAFNDQTAELVGDSIICYFGNTVSPNIALKRDGRYRGPPLSFTLGNGDAFESPKLLRGSPMKKLLIVSVGAVLLANAPAHAIDAKYREKLERSGCTQVTEMQGCDINKTKAENARAGFGASSHAKPTPAPRYKDLAGKKSIRAIDIMANRGFEDVDSIESGNTLYGIFYHPGSRLCVQLTIADGKVISADDIKTHPKCR